MKTTWSVRALVATACLLALLALVVTRLRAAPPITATATMLSPSVAAVRVDVQGSGAYRLALRSTTIVFPVEVTRAPVGGVDLPAPGTMTELVYGENIKALGICQEEPITTQAVTSGFDMWLTMSDDSREDSQQDPQQVQLVLNVPGTRIHGMANRGTQAADGDGVIHLANVFTINTATNELHIIDIVATPVGRRNASTLSPETDDDAT